MFERVSRQVESSPCCDWGTPSSVYALHARNGAMFGPVEIGDSSTHQGALPCGASRFGLVNDGACAFADGGLHGRPHRENAIAFGQFRHPGCRDRDPMGRGHRRR